MGRPISLDCCETSATMSTCCACSHHKPGTWCPALPAPLPLLTGDRLEVRRYERLSPLQAARRPLADLSQVQRGDCVVSFSRREVHAVRQEIQSHGRERCCVIYGALPPDARQLQASLFNTPRTGEGLEGLQLGLGFAVGVLMNAT